MKKIEIFDPAMCCPTGLCGTNINPELMRIAVVIESLKKQGIIVTRHNLRDEPQVYVSNKTVNDFLQKHGADALPYYFSRWRNSCFTNLSYHQTNE